MPRVQKAGFPPKDTAKSDAISLESTRSQLPVKAPPLPQGPEPVNRTKHKIILRETDEGVEEVTQHQSYQEVPDTLQKETAANKPEVDAIPDERRNGLDAANGKQLTGLAKESFSSTTSDWNAYAGKSGRFEVGAIPWPSASG